MTPEMFEAVSAIAQHCCKTHHWVKTPKGPVHVRAPLSKPKLEKHLDGGQGVGLCPMAPGSSTTRLALLDFDSHKGEVPWEAMRARAYQVSARLQAHGLQPIPFRSSGGHGIHLIMLWDEPQDAYSVRALLVEVLEELGLKNGTKGLRENQVEVFPKQDAIAEDGWGSMFILPLNAESVQLEYSSFAVIDPLSYTSTPTWPKSAPVPARERPVQDSAAFTEREHSKNTEELRFELGKIPNNDLDYDAWFRVICAIHHATGGSEEGHFIASEWSRQSPKHNQEFLDERVWPYIKHDRGGPVVTIDTIRRLARQHEDPIDDFEALPPLGQEHDDPAQAGKPATATGAAPAAPLKYPPIHTSEFLKRAPPKWRVPGIVPEAPLMVVFGEPASGKSFWTLDLVAHIATGMAYKGREVVQGNVLYVAAEGAGGFRNRLEALCLHYELDPAQLPLYVIDGAPDFMQTAEVREIQAACKELKQRTGEPPAMIVIDTLARVMPGADENSSEGMGKVIAQCAALARSAHATVLLIHHSGKDASRGARGWSGLYGATDQEVNITRAGDQRAATISKSKDGKDGESFPFTLPTIELAAPGDTSCWVKHATESQIEAMQQGEPKHPRQRAAFRSLKGACDFGPVPTSVALECIESQLPEMPKDTPESRRNRAQQALTSLLDTRWAVQLELRPGDTERQIIIGRGPNAR